MILNKKIKTNITSLIRSFQKIQDKEQLRYRCSSSSPQIQKLEKANLFVEYKDFKNSLEFCDFGHAVRLHFVILAML